MMYIMLSSYNFQVTIIMSSVCVHVHVSDEVHRYFTLLEIRFFVDHMTTFDGVVISVLGKLYPLL